MRNLTSTRVEGTLISLFTMAEGDSSSSFSEAETDSILSGSAYYQRCLITLRPYLFEPERSSSSDSEEMTEVVDHPSEERLGNADWYVNTDATAKSFDV